MKKIIKLFSITVLSLIIGLVTIVPISADNSEFTELNELYSSIYKTKIANDRVKRSIENDNKFKQDSEFMELINSSDTHIPESFYEFIYEVSRNPNFYDLFKEKQFSKGVIFENSTTGSINMIYLESEQLLIKINDKEYTIFRRGSDLIVSNETNEELPVIQEKYIGEDSGEFPINTDFNTTRATRSPWGKEGPGLKFSWTGMINLLGWVSGGATLGGLVAAKYGHPVLGTVLGFVAAGATVGSKLFHKNYTIKYTSTSTTCSVYHRQRIRWYELSNYNEAGYIGTSYDTFYSTNPSYAGC